MLATRVIPCLLLLDKGLVKTRRFKDPVYVGDPINAVKIFNEKEVDELVFLDIGASVAGTKPPFDVIAGIASECFMPFSYGGGITDIDDVKRLFGLGVEKVIVNSRAAQDPGLIEQAAAIFGSQSVIVSIDVRKTMLGNYEVYTRSGRTGTGRDPVSYAKAAEAAGAGEVLLTSIDRDGTMGGYDLKLTKNVSSALSVPVIACGGAGTLAHFAEAVRDGGASAVAAGSMFVFHGRHRAVLINYPRRDELEAALP